MKSCTRRGKFPRLSLTRGIGAAIMRAALFSLMKRLLQTIAVLLTAVTIPASAQVWDFSGNGKLSGTYLFREVIYGPNTSGTIARAIIVYGNIVFDGNGKYVINETRAIHSKAQERTPIFLAPIRSRPAAKASWSIPISPAVRSTAPFRQMEPSSAVPRRLGPTTS